MILGLRLKGLMMTPYLNDDTFQDDDWTDPQKMGRLIDVIQKSGFGRVVVFAQTAYRLSIALKSDRLCRNIKDRMRSLFTKPYENLDAEADTPFSERSNQKRYEINVVSAAYSLDGRKFARSFFRGGMLLGIAGSKYGDYFSYKVKERDDKGQSNEVFTSYMATLPKHVHEPILRRWLYAYRAANNIECANNMDLVRFPPDHTKHFFARTVDEKMLVESTKSGKSFGRNRIDNAAKFLSSIQKASYAYAYLLSSVLRLAFVSRRYEEDEQNRFSVDVGVDIGAANGRMTKVVCLYVTNGIDIHIRPFEGEAQVVCTDIGRKLKDYL